MGEEHKYINPKITKREGIKTQKSVRSPLKSKQFSQHRAELIPQIVQKSILNFSCPSKYTYVQNDKLPASEPTASRVITAQTTIKHKSVFIPGFFFWGGVSPSPQKAYNFPPNGWQSVCSKSFLAGTMNYQYHGNFLLMDNKHGKLSVIKQSKRCKFMSKMHQNTIGSRALPGTAGEAYVLPRSPSHNGGAYF